MIFRFLSFLRGYLIIEVSGIFLERFINLAIKSNIFLWDIRKIQKNKATMKISVRGFFHIRKAVRKTGVDIKILKRCGIPLFVHKHRKRKAFYLGFLSFVLIIAFLTSFIWTVEIEETKSVDREMIREALYEKGIKAGALKYGHKIHAIQDKLMMEIPGISWIWVEIRGTRAIVSVRERTEKPEIFDKNQPCNIVANFDGVIEKITVINGEQVVQNGDVVKKGALLISGAYNGKYGGVRLVHSEGEVIATTWHSKEEAFPLEKVVSERTGEEQRQILVSFAGKDIKVFPLFKKDFKKAETTEKFTQIRLFGDLYLPFGIKEVKAYEISESKIKMSEKEAFAYYKELLFKELIKEYKDAEILEKTAEEETSGGKIKIKATIKCRQNIAGKTAIQTGG